MLKTPAVATLALLISIAAGLQASSNVVPASSKQKMLYLMDKLVPDEEVRLRASTELNKLSEPEIDAVFRSLDAEYYAAKDFSQFLKNSITVMGIVVLAATPLLIGIFDGTTEYMNH